MGRIRRTASIAVIACVMLSASRAGADPAASVPGAQTRITDLRDDYSLPPWPEPPNTGGLLLRLVLGTVAALALCAGSLWFGRKWLRGNLVATGPGGQLRVLESVSLGNRCFVHLVQAGEARVLAGTDSAGLKALLAVPSPFPDILAARLERSTEGDTPAVADDLLVPEALTRARDMPAGGEEEAWTASNKSRSV
jgi:flagellar biogenesis protein FliO